MSFDALDFTMLSVRRELDVGAPSLIEQIPGPEIASFEVAVDALRARLRSLPGLDADLLLAVLVLEEDQRQVAGRLGLTHEAVRKRFQRALSRARSYRDYFRSVIDD
jgi:DNA-directed RNA polymerase specialized sigma24 family protein